ncbi:MAG: hypothetical protein HON98_07420 [Chloroflexi bacterium]|jgi:hypothetical protein|nr:hypothetical protein [Chloroflexota bacterium]MBT3669773.1 hypothetical protein [Chloroflexota bacterium]MBT4003169.1 hypothetical protein [Chloroflexota bacterium]MBT4305253.1 hypothetical protein [Chloroflexota bacterium]MBT4534824.1 hypothetical protein [Chloroflexota bacterium]
MQTIYRVLSKNNLNQFISDFDNLIKIVNNSQGELDLAIRNAYVNLYFKGNSLAKIEFNKDQSYKISIHKKFFEGTKGDSEEFYANKSFSGEYAILTLNAEKPPLRFLQKAHINQFAAMIKKVNYGEEIVFEQALITDNLGREDLIIIDRQITDKILRGKRLDLLALKQVEKGSNQFNFLVIEVKLGNNPELRGDVAGQVTGYKNHIEEHFEDYRECYEIQYIQKKDMGLKGYDMFDKVNIIKPIKGIVVVASYSKIAKTSILELRNKYPEIDVQLFEYIL